MANEPIPFSPTRRLVCFALLALASLPVSVARAQNNGPNLLTAGNFDSVAPALVPWAGVDAAGNIHGFDGHQLAVDDNGTIRSSAFGPSVAVGDLNGDGKPDLVLADTKGYFWYFPNSGMSNKPAFTQGEVMPIWLGRDSSVQGAEGIESIVPRIQLVDFDNSNSLDIVAGTYPGELYFIRNNGTPDMPSFKPTYNRDSILIDTHKNGLLWCNYLAPFMTTMFNQQNVLDLIMGEGSYSANSIYLLRNTGTNTNPSFDENHMEKIVPGLGLEQLTPAVLDWNNDGKPDIICGDRTGFIDLFLNTTTDPDHPTFAPPSHVRIAGVEKLGNSITVSIGDLTGNQLPNLLIGRDDGTILYALNTGRIGAPAFNIPAQPIKGVLPADYHYSAPTNWSSNGAWGSSYEVLSCVNPQLEPGFAFPEGENSKYALKFFVWPAKNRYFTERFNPPVENNWNEHFVGCNQHILLELNQKYRVHFWVKATGNFSDLHYKLYADRISRPGFRGYDVINPIDARASWSEVTSEITVSNPDDKTVTNWGYRFEVDFAGQPTLYIDDVQIEKESN